MPTKPKTVRIPVTLLRALTGDDTEEIGNELDHWGYDFSRWYRAVVRARKLLPKEKP